MSTEPQGRALGIRHATDRLPGQASFAPAFPDGPERCHTDGQFMVARP